MTTQDIDGPAAARPTRDLSRPLLWVAAAAVAVRGLHLVETVRSVFFGVPILDEAFYDLVARRLALGAPVADINPGFRALLYPAFLAIWRAVSADHGLFLAIAAQHLLGLGTALLVAVFAGRLFRRRSAALLAGLLYALAGPPLFYEGRLLITTLFTCLFAWLLVVAGSCRPATAVKRTIRLGPWWAAGLLVAITVQARPNALVLLLAFPLIAVLGARPTTRGFARHKPWLAAWTSAGALLMLLAAVQAPFVGGFEPLPAAGGINLYLGNERGADGMVPRQDRHAVYGDIYRDSVQLFAAEEFRRERGHDGTPAEVSRYWLSRTADEFRADPFGRLALLLRKTWLLAWPPEVPNNLAYHFVAEHDSTLLPWLPVRWVWLLPLASAGAWIAFRRRQATGGTDGVRLAWLLTFGALHAATVVAFFVAGRFRIPLWPLAAILAAGALVSLADAVRTPRSGSLTVGRRDAAIAVVIALVVLGVGQLTWPGVELPSQARDFFYRSVAREQAGDVEGALQDARRAVELEPSNPQALFQLGTAALGLEDWDLAATALFDASRLLHVEPRPFNNLGIALEKQGHVGDAYNAYLRAIEVGADFSPAWVNAALLELRAGRADLAAPKVERAEELERMSGHTTVHTLAARAFVERDRGNPDAATRAWAAAEAMDYQAAQLLLRDNGQRLELTFRDSSD